MKTAKPIIGNWYCRPDGGLFEIVAIDNDEGSIGIQHFDGTVEELEIDAWTESVFMPAEAPEDWSGSLDVDPVEVAADVDSTSSKDWSTAMDYVDHAE